MLDDEVLYSVSESGLERAASLTSPFLIKQDELRTIFGVSFLPSNIDDFLARYADALKAFIGDEELQHTFLILEEENKLFDNPQFMSSTPTGHISRESKRRALFELYIQVFASCLFNAKEFDQSSFDRVLTHTSMVIFNHVKASRPQANRKKLFTFCRLYALIGDAVSYVFMEAFRTTVLLTHNLIRDESLDWSSLVHQDFQQIVSQVKREGELRHKDLVDSLQKQQGSTPEDTKSPITVLLSMRLTEAIEYLINRVSTFPSPIIDSRYSILGFYDSHSKKAWTEVIVNAEFLRLRKTASVSRSTIGDQPLGWISLLHVASFADNQVFDGYHGQIVIPLSLPLTVDVPSETSFPLPLLARQAVKTRTKTKFTLPNASLIRESPLGWSRFIQAVLLLLSTETTESSLEAARQQMVALMSSKSDSSMTSLDGTAPRDTSDYGKSLFDGGLSEAPQLASDRNSVTSQDEGTSFNDVEDILLRVSVEGELDGRRLCRLLIVLIANGFLGKRPHDTRGQGHDAVNVRAMMLYKWILKWFHPSLIREAAIHLLTTHTKLLLTTVATSATPTDESGHTDGSIVPVDYDDKLLLAWSPGKDNFVAPTADVAMMQAATGRTATLSIMKNDFAFPITNTALLNHGFFGVLALLIADNVLDFEETWQHLDPCDSTLRAISTLILLCHLREKNPLLGKVRRDEYVAQLTNPRVVAELQIFWPEWKSQDASSCESTIHGVFKSSKTMLLTMALSLNLQKLSNQILDKFKELDFPFNRISSIRKAYGRVVHHVFCGTSITDLGSSKLLFPAIEVGDLSGLSWSRIQSYEHFVSEGAQILSPMASWMDTTVEAHQQIARYAKEHVSRLHQSGIRAVEDPLLRHVILEVLLPALLLSPVPSEPPGTSPFSAIPPSPTTSRKESLDQVPQALVLSDLIWDVIGTELTASDRYSLYVDFFLVKLRSVPLRHYSAGDRKTVNKALKKVTAAEISPSATTATTQTGQTVSSPLPPDSTQLMNYVVGSKKPRQLSKKDRNISAVICRYACNNPFETLDCVLHHIELFDPLVIKVVLEYLRALTRLGADVAMFLVIERQQNRELLAGGDWDMVSSKPKRLRNVALFAARFLRRFPWVLPKPILVSIVSRMIAAVNDASFPRNVSGVFGDYVYLQEILSWVGSCPCLSVSEISELQYEALSGGTFLRKIVFTDEDIRDEELRPGGGQCRTSLRDCLIDPSIFKGLVFSLCKMSLGLSLECEPASMRLNVKDQLRAIQESVDSVDSCLSHLMDFITLPSPMISVSKSHLVETQPSRSIRILPTSMWPSLFQHCHLAIAWLLIRWVAPPAITYDEVKSQRLVFGARVTRADWSNFVESFVLPELMDGSSPSVTQTHKVQLVSLEGLLTFWQLSLVELLNPVKLYHSQIQKLQDELRAVEGQRKQVTSDVNSIKDLERKERKLREAKDALEKEKEVKQSITTSVRNCIQTYSHEWFLRDPVAWNASVANLPYTDQTTVDNFVQYSDIGAYSQFLTKMVFPRAVSSAGDAIYCAEFCTHLLNAGAPGIHLVTLTYLAIKTVSPLLMSCTDRESDNLGIFIIRILQYVQSLVSAPSSIKQQPAFMLPPWEESLMTEGQLGQLLVLLEWELASHVLEHALEVPAANEENTEIISSSWFTIRRSLRFLNQAAKVFPVTKVVNTSLMSKLQALNEYNNQEWKDIVALSKALDKRTTSTKKIEKTLERGLKAALSQEHDSLNRAALSILQAFVPQYDTPAASADDEEMSSRNGATENTEVLTGSRKRRRLPDEASETPESKSPVQLSRVPPKSSDQAPKASRANVEEGDETEERLKARALQKWYDRRQHVPRVNGQAAPMIVAAAAVNRKPSEAQSDTRRPQIAPRTSATSKAIHHLSSNTGRAPPMNREPPMLESRPPPNPLPPMDMGTARKGPPYSMSSSVSLARSKEHENSLDSTSSMYGVKRRRSGYEQTLNRPLLDERKRPPPVEPPPMKGFSPRREEWPRHEAWSNNVHMSRPHYGPYGGGGGGGGGGPYEPPPPRQQFCKTRNHI